MRCCSRTAQPVTISKGAVWNAGRHIRRSTYQGSANSRKLIFDSYLVGFAVALLCTYLSYRILMKDHRCFWQACSSTCISQSGNHVPCLLSPLLEFDPTIFALSNNVS